MSKIPSQFLKHWNDIKSFNWHTTVEKSTSAACVSSNDKCSHTGLLNVTQIKLFRNVEGISQIHLLCW